MDARDKELEKELAATLDARRELGEDYDAALVESFLEKVEQRLDTTVDRRVRRQLAEQQMVVARGGTRPGGRDAEHGFGGRYGVAVVTLVLAIPLSAIGASHAGLPGLLVTWLGIVGVSTAHASRRWPWQRDRRGTGDESGA
ncbi:hypothetical protein [Streptomyces sp. C10-9-1]|uniref:hypothetical protein n=1 Tax=Streptomyces sp. C10-9-1 TaxID=1859285 RepID=UPI003D7180EB